MRSYSLPAINNERRLRERRQHHANMRSLNRKRSVFLRGYRCWVRNQTYKTRPASTLTLPDLNRLGRRIVSGPTGADSAIGLRHVATRGLNLLAVGVRLLVYHLKVAA